MVLWHMCPDKLLTIPKAPSTCEEECASSQPPHSQLSQKMIPSEKSEMVPVMYWSSFKKYGSESFL